MISLCSVAQRAIQRRSLDEIAEGQVRRGPDPEKESRRSLWAESCWRLGWAGLYTPQNSGWVQVQIGVPNCDWSTIWDAVDAVGARRSEDAPLGYSCLTCWFPGRFSLEAANSHWPLTSAGSPRWIPRDPNSYWLVTQTGSLSQPCGMRNFSLAKSPGCFPLRRRGRNLRGSLREASCGGVFSWFSEDAGEVRSPWYRVGGGAGSGTQFRYLSQGGRVTIIIIIIIIIIYYYYYYYYYYYHYHHYYYCSLYCYHYYYHVLVPNIYHYSCYWCCCGSGGCNIGGIFRIGLTENLSRTFFFLSRGQTFVPKTSFKSYSLVR